MTPVRRIAFPVPMRSEPEAVIRATEPDLRARLGTPGHAVDDPALFPGPVLLWAFDLGEGLLAVIEFHRDKDFAHVVISRPDLKSVLERLHLSGLPVEWRCPR